MFWKNLLLALLLLPACAKKEVPIAGALPASERGGKLQTLSLNPETAKTIHASPHIGFLADGTGALRLSEIIGRRDFRYEENNSIHQGFTGETLWFHFRYRYQKDTPQPLLLMLGNFALHYVDFYFVKDGRLLEIRLTGQARPFVSRYGGLREFASPLPVDTEPIDLYLRIKSSTTIYFNPVIKTGKSVAEKESLDQIVAGFIFGAQAVLILFNFFLFLSLRDRSYLHYSMYILSWLIFELNNAGFLAKYMLPNHPEWDCRILPANSLLIHGFFMIFAERFMQIATGFTRNILKYAGAAFLLLAIPAVFTPQPYTNQILLTFTFPVEVVILVHAYHSIRLHRPSAGYFMAATLVSLLMIPLFVLTRVLRVDADNYTVNALLYYTLPLTIVAEAVIFSFALADRYRRLREENASQRQALATELKRERHQIFAELHDIIGSDLTLLMMKTADAKSKPMQQLRERVTGISQSLRDLLDLEDIDPDLPQKFAGHIEDRAREIAAVCKMHLKIDLAPVIVSARVAFHLQRFAFEALANAMRHSAASQLVVRLVQRGPWIHFLIADNGVGLQKTVRSKGRGLRNLAARARSLKGRVRLFTRPQKGVAVIFSFQSGRL